MKTKNIFKFCITSFLGLMIFWCFVPSVRAEDRTLGQIAVSLIGILLVILPYQFEQAFPIFSNGLSGKVFVIVLQLLGLGRNGHIGFNEPGTPFDSTTHKIKLTQSTIDANSRFFEREEDDPKEAYSMGIGSIMTDKHILLEAYGDKKAEAIQKMIQGSVTTDVPASVLQNHPNVTVIIDEAAAALLDRSKLN